MIAPLRAALREKLLELVETWTNYRAQRPRSFNGEMCDDIALEREDRLIGLFLRDLLALREALLASDASPQEAAPRGGWQPIATAPKDGSEFLAVVHPKLGYPDMAICRWDIKYEPHEWATREGYYLFPTHWMRFPSLPALASLSPQASPQDAPVVWKEVEDERTGEPLFIPTKASPDKEPTWSGFPRRVTPCWRCGQEAPCGENCPCGAYNAEGK